MVLKTKDELAKTTRSQSFVPAANPVAEAMPRTELESNCDRRERLRQLALETIDLTKDPYFMKNRFGSYECKLCLTLHNNEGSYLLHRAKSIREIDPPCGQRSQGSAFEYATGEILDRTEKVCEIGRPGYRVTKQRNSDNGQLLFQIDYPQITDGSIPRHRFVSAYEQKIEPPDRKWLYLLFAAEPYETIALKVPSREVEKTEGKFWIHRTPSSSSCSFRSSWNRR